MIGRNFEAGVDDVNGNDLDSVRTHPRRNRRGELAHVKHRAQSNASFTPNESPFTSTHAIDRSQKHHNDLKTANNAQN